MRAFKTLRGSVRRLAVLVATVAVAACCVEVPSAAAARVVGTIKVGGHAAGVVDDGTHLWATNREGTITEIEASTGTVIRTISVGRTYDDVSSDGTHLWLTNTADKTVTEIEASTGTVIRTIILNVYPENISADAKHVWVTSEEEAIGGVLGHLTEIEASTGTVIRTVASGSKPGAVSSDGTHVWVANPTSGTVSDIEASTGMLLQQIGLSNVGYMSETPGGEPVDVTSDGTHVWVANRLENMVDEIEASTGLVLRTILVWRPEAVSSNGTHAWVTNSEGTVSEIEVSTGAVIGTIKLGSAWGVASDSTHAWVGNPFEGTVSEILPAPECTSNSGTIALSPGLTATAAVQTMKIKGVLAECTGEAFKEAKYTATLQTAAPVSCAVLKTAGEEAVGSAKYSWVPTAKASAGPLSLPLAEPEKPDIVFSGEVTVGSYWPLTLTGTVTEGYAGGATCGEAVGNKAAKAVKKGEFIWIR